MKKLILSLITGIFSHLLFAQPPQLIPKPVQLNISSSSEYFSINSQTNISYTDVNLSASAQFLSDYLKKYYELSISIVPEVTSSNTISLLLDPKLSENKDTYQLTTTNKLVEIKGNSPEAVFYGIQSLIQLLPSDKNIKIPALQIVDYPRFDYRGMHLDVSRHFFDVNFVKRYIDFLAFHKMNYFHWHLTDDHGWRIEIKKYPKLTEIGAWRKGSIIGLFPGKGNENIRYQVLPNAIKITPENAVLKTDGIPHGGFYTQEDVKEIIEYAKSRYITIIPEIEMPAHSMAVLAAYPEFGTEPNKKSEVAQTWGMFNKYNNVLQPTENTFKFLEDVLTEVMDLFPSPYIHIGGDEAAKVWWKNSAVSQQIMRDNQLKSENELQSYFIHRIEKFVNQKGKTIIGWDEIMDGGLAPNAVVMSWRGEKGGIAAAKMKQKVIMTPENKLYLNHSQFLKDDSLTAAKYLPLDVVYNYDPIPQELSSEQTQYIWGAQGNLWTEYIANPKKVEYMLFPRLDALSEILWSPKNQKNYSDFLNRLKSQFKRYDFMGISYPKRYLEK